MQAIKSLSAGLATQVHVFCLSTCSAIFKQAAVKAQLGLLLQPVTGQVGQTCS